MMRYLPAFLIFFLTQTNAQDDDSKALAASDDAYNVLQRDGSYEFGYANRDRGASYHFEDANSRNVVRGKFGSRNPGTGRIDETIYTAGPRGFRPRGPNVHRKYNLNQNGPRPIGNRDDPLFDPSEDPSYSFGFRTRTYNRDETANRNADVSGRYSFIDDVGERHNVEYIAGKNTGFHVKTAYPDSNPRPWGPLRYAGKRPIGRGRTSIQRGLDGSYRFEANSVDQRRSETSDSNGNVRGSYMFVDDKGKQHSVHYIAGPNIGYRVLKTSKDFPSFVPFGPRPLPPGRPFGPTDLPTAYDDYIFSNPDEGLNTAASGHVKPRPNPTRPSSTSSRPTSSIDDDDDDNSLDDFFGGIGVTPTKPTKPFTNTRPGSTLSTINHIDNLGPTAPSGPSGSGYDDDDEDEDVFGSDTPNKPSSGKPTLSTTLRPPSSTYPSSTSTTPTSHSSSHPDSDGYDSGHSSNPNRPQHETTFNIYSDDDDWTGPPPLGGTILRNLGRKNVNLPPGIAVRAHVQSIDILPYGSRLPSPATALERDS